MEDKLLIFNHLKDSLQQNTFVKLTLSDHTGKTEDLKNVYLKRILIKNEEKISFTYRYKTKDIVKNYSIDEALTLLDNLILNDFRILNLFTISSDYSLERLKADKFRLKTFPASIKQVPSMSHDNVKNRKIENSQLKKYLQLLEITDSTGKVLAKSQDKFKQINHYIEILSSLLKDFKTDGTIKIADMGSGKGYLTFALYDYLTDVLKLNCEITGVEFRPELVKLCNKFSQDCNFAGLKFVEGAIENFEFDKTDVIIALHACDTATDDAIAKGIKAGAELIVTAPCCQHQIRQQMEKSDKVNDLSPITKYGIFMERQAELITDSIRALILEYFGYKTKVVEFIADAHTHKNVMIIGQKNTKKSNDKEILNRINSIKEMFGIEFHYLEKVTGIIG
jgi:SAM-dependent methyltransferase